MKHKLWSHHLTGACFAFALSVSAAGNLVTGYNLNVTTLPKLLLLCAFFALLSSLLLRFPRGEVILLCLSAFLSLFLWKKGVLWEQLQTLIYAISDHYHDVYEWPVFGKRLTDDVTLPVILLCAWSAFTVSWVYCRRKPIFLALPPVLTPLILCLVTIDHVPDGIYLYLLVTILAFLFLTGWTRRNHPEQTSAMILRLAVPLALAFAVLFLANPQNTYENRAYEFQQRIASYFQKLYNATEFFSQNIILDSASTEKVNLKNVGPKSKSSYAVMRIHAPTSGTVYLRGRDYDIYSGTGWEASGNRQELFTPGGAAAVEFTIVTYGIRDIRYIPYYVTTSIHLVDGAVTNDESLQSYRYSVSNSHGTGSSLPDTRYTHLPSATLDWASDLADQITASAEADSERIIAIKNYVRDRAAYDLNTGRMSADQKDFARWFLEESETGYCVHFASAATVLLRAAGIPARYVEGYAVDCTADSDTVVTSMDAHAWSEYYDADSGAWQILEATPPDFMSMDETKPPINPTEAETEDPVPETESVPAESDPTDHPDDIGPDPEDSEPASKTPDSASPDDATESPQKKPFRLPDWTKTLFKYLLAVLMIPLQGCLRIRIKKKRWNEGHPNEMTLVRCKQVSHTARILKTGIPPELDALAQKAKFSQHEIAPEELEQFDICRHSQLERLRHAPWYTRMICTCIFAIG